MPERAAFLLASLLALSASACGSSSDGDRDGGGGGGGCGEAAGIALGEWVEQTVSVPGGSSRVYFVWLPAGYDPDERYPVVYQLHGCSDSATPENNNVPVQNQSGDEAIHVRGRAAANCWDTTTDLPYFDAVVADVEGTYCADPDRRLLTGYSSGAFFAHRIACVRGDTVRGIATIAGGSPGGGCVGEVAVLQIHDANDQTVLIDPVGYPTRDYWVMANGCETTSAPTDSPPCVAYGGCNAGAPVVWCETTGQDHARQDALAAPIFWDFLSSL